MDNPFAIFVRKKTNKQKLLKGAGGGTIQKSSPLTRVGPLSQNGNGSWTCFLSSICIGQVRHNNNDKQDITTVTNDTFSLAPLLVWTQMILPPKTQEFWHEKSGHTEKLPRLHPRTKWRAKCATSCQAESMVMFAGGVNCCHGDRLRTQGVGSTSDRDNQATNINKCSSLLLD